MVLRSCFTAWVRASLPSAESASENAVPITPALCPIKPAILGVWASADERLIEGSSPACLRVAAFVLAKPACCFTAHHATLCCLLLMKILHISQRCLCCAKPTLPPILLVEQVSQKSRTKEEALPHMLRSMLPLWHTAFAHYKLHQRRTCPQAAQGHLTTRG